MEALVKIITIIILLIFTFTFPVTGQRLRDYVCIIKPHVREQLKDTFLQVAGRFEENGYDDIASIFKAFAEGGHGSGFVYIDDSGKTYIVTNRHVVVQSTKVDIKFEQPDGTLKTYDNCAIMYIDDQLDIALIVIPEEAKEFKQGFNIDEKQYPDGTEVFSVGYPGLLGRPGWQFAQGIITNERARIPEMVDPELSTVIQHSAPIDPGNSGGPLLIRNPGEPLQYRVIGINTWSVDTRNNTFFALPAKNINTVIKKAQKRIAMKDDPEQMEKELIRSCEMLATELGSDSPDMNKLKNYISYSFVSRKGWDSFLTVLNLVSNKEREKWEETFFTYDPIETMRTALFFHVYSSIEEKGDRTHLRFSEIISSDRDNFPENNQIRTVFIIDENSFEITWAFEFGHWLIADMELMDFSHITGFDLRTRDLIESWQNRNPLLYATLHAGTMIPMCMGFGIEAGGKIGLYIVKSFALNTGVSIYQTILLFGGGGFTLIQVPFSIRIDQGILFFELGGSFGFYPFYSGEFNQSYSARATIGVSLLPIELYMSVDYSISTLLIIPSLGLQLNYTLIKRK